jgi:hypothetical protein
MLGYTREELKHKKWQELVHPQEFENLQKKWILYFLENRHRCILWPALSKKISRLFGQTFFFRYVSIRTMNPCIILPDRGSYERIKIESIARSKIFRKYFETTTLPTIFLMKQTIWFQQTILIAVW